MILPGTALQQSTDSNGQGRWLFTRIEPSSFLYPIHDGTDRGLTLKPRSPLLGETEKRPIDAPAFLPPTSIFI